MQALAPSHPTLQKIDEVVEMIYYLKLLKKKHMYKNQALNFRRQY